MSFQSLRHVLGNLETRCPPQERQLQQIRQHWGEVVGAVVAAQSRPFALQRDVLQVATASSAWAQNLVFERQRILAKLNTLLGLSVVDIRFSTAHWKRSQKPQMAIGSEQQVKLWQEHPSSAGEQLRLPKLPPVQDPTDPLQAFQRWAILMRSRSHQLPLCPQCQCPTPAGELARWRVCALCVTKLWKE
jgi:predicted nucleic acid-binding Zn ribbon protein